MKPKHDPMPLSGGDYIQTDKGLQRVTEPTRPPKPKSASRSLAGERNALGLSASPSTTAPRDKPKPRPSAD